MAEASTNKMPTGAYVVGGLSFIPLVGVAFGLAAIVWGLVAGKKTGRITVILLGLAGIVLSTALYGGLYYYGFQQRGGTFDTLRNELAQSNLDALVKEVEFHKMTKGAYPATLDAMNAPGAMPSVHAIDPYAQVNGSTSLSFFYQLIDPDHYYLRSTGPDGKAFTADDVVPKIEAGGASKIGLVLDPPKS